MRKHEHRRKSFKFRADSYPITNIQLIHPNMLARFNLNNGRSRTFFGRSLWASHPIKSVSVLLLVPVIFPWPDSAYSLFYALFGVAVFIYWRDLLIWSSLGILSKVAVFLSVFAVWASSPQELYSEMYFSPSNKALKILPLLYVNNTLP